MNLPLTALFLLGLLSALVLCTSAFANLLRDDLQFWPPPGQRSWQGRMLRWGFRALVYSALILSAWTLWAQGLRPLSPALLIVAAASTVCGFALAFFGTRHLGWDAAFGDDKGLRTDGVFKRSRNPIYAATWLGLAGWAVVVPDVRVTILLALWALLYIPAAFLEERGLRRTYGAAFETYATKVPRFLDWRSFTISKG